MSSLDEQGLVRLAEAERTALVTFAKRRLGDRQDEAEDAVQDALVKALRALRKGATPENGRAWLFTILAHCCVDARSTAARRPTLPVLEDFDVADAAAPSVARTAETRAEVAHAVRAISGLPEAQRQALVGYELGGDTYEQLGARHGWSVSATKSLLWRARARLVEERASWAAIGGAPLAAFRSLFTHADKPVGLLAAPFSAEALGCVAAAALGATAIGLPAASEPPPAAAAGAPAGKSAPAVAPRTRPVAQRAVVAQRPAAAVTAVTAARSADPTAVVIACRAQEELAGRFTAPALLRARRALPADAAEYSRCAAAIDRTLVRGG